jgi:hypothetical protein
MPNLYDQQSMMGTFPRSHNTCHLPLHVERSELNFDAPLNIPVAYLREGTEKESEKELLRAHCFSKGMPNMHGQTIYDGNLSCSQSTCHLPCHAERSALKFDAPLNIFEAFVTLESFQSDKSWLKASALENIESMDMTFETSHAPIYG